MVYTESPKDTKECISLISYFIPKIPQISREGTDTCAHTHTCTHAYKVTASCAVSTNTSSPNSPSPLKVAVCAGQSWNAATHCTLGPVYIPKSGHIHTICSWQFCSLDTIDTQISSSETSGGEEAWPLFLSHLINKRGRMIFSDSSFLVVCTDLGGGVLLYSPKMVLSDTLASATGGLFNTTTEDVIMKSLRKFKNIH